MFSTTRNCLTCWLLFVNVDADCPHLAGVDPAPLSPQRRHVNESSCLHRNQRGKQCQCQYGHDSIPVLGIDRCPYRYWHCRDGVHFQYWASISAHTSIGTAAMAFISSTGTCQVPAPVLAMPRWHSFPVWALAKCPHQYWHCRDGVHFQCGHLPSARTSIGTIHYQQWQIFAADADKFYHTLEKCG
jgi:hypothetical protein